MRWVFLLCGLGCGGPQEDGFSLDASGCGSGVDSAQFYLDGGELEACNPEDSEVYLSLRTGKNGAEQLNGLVAEARSRCYLIRYCELYEAECGPLDDPCDLIER